MPNLKVIDMNYRISKIVLIYNIYVNSLVFCIGKPTLRNLIVIFGLRIKIQSQIEKSTNDSAQCYTGGFYLSILIILAIFRNDSDYTRQVGLTTPSDKTF